MTLPQFGQPINRSQASGGGGGSDGWELIEDITVPADTTQVDITGLDGDSDELYLLIGSVIASGGLCELTLRFNGDSGSNYRWGRARVFGGNIAGQQNNSDTHIFGDIPIADGEVGNLEVIIHPQTGQTRSVKMYQGGRFGATNNRLALVFGEWLNTAENLEVINLRVFSGASTIGAGSRFYLFKKAQ